MKRSKQWTYFLVIILFLFNSLIYADSGMNIYAAGGEEFFLTIEFATASNTAGDFIRAKVNSDNGTLFLVESEYAGTAGGDPSIFKSGTSMSPAYASYAETAGKSTFTKIETGHLMAGSYDLYYVKDDEVLCSKLASVTIFDANGIKTHLLSNLKVLGSSLSDFDSKRFNYLVKVDQEQYDSINLVDQISATPQNSTATTYIIEGNASNNARIQVFDMPDFGPLPYTVTVIVGDGTSDTSDDTSDVTPATEEESSSDIAPINRQIEELLNLNLSEDQLLERTTVLFDQLETTLQSTETSEEAELVFKDLGTTVENIGKVLRQIEQTDQLIESVAKLTDNSRKLVITIDDSEKVTRLTTGYFNKLNSIISQIKPEDYQTKNLKNKVYNLGTEAVVKTGIYQTNDAQLKISNQKAEVQFDETKVLKYVDQANTSFSSINNAMKTLLGNQDPRNLKRKLTLSIDKPANVKQVESTLEKSLLNQMDAKGQHDISVNIADVAVSFTKEVLKSDENTLQVSTEFLSQSVVTPPKGSNSVRDATVADITMRSENEIKDKFSKPIVLEFNLKDLGLANVSDAYLNNLSIYVQDPETFEWQSVGGNYDPVTKTIKTYRMGLSKYTVMQSQKSFSDVENSWAQDEINELLGKGIIDNTSDFNPKSPATREEFTTWVAKSYGLTSTELSIPFEDIPKDHPHYDEIATAYTQGIISGKSSSVFDPKGYITREELSAIVSNALTEYEGNTLSLQLTSNIDKYQDSDTISSWARDTVSLVDELGIMRGDDVAFRPKDNVTKEEAAAIIKRIYD